MRTCAAGDGAVEEWIGAVFAWCTAGGGGGLVVCWGEIGWGGERGERG